MSNLPPHRDNTSDDKRTSYKEERSFGLLFTVVFLLIGLYPLLAGAEVRLWSLLAAVVLLAIALLLPILLWPFNWLWMRFGALLHHIMNPVLMAVIFFLTIVPTALLMRLFGKDPLMKKFDAEKSSYWIPRDPPGPDGESLKNQF